MQLHKLMSVSSPHDGGFFVAAVDLTDASGERYVCDYCVRPSDQFGLAPIVREAVEKWIADGNPISTI